MSQDITIPGDEAYLSFGGWAKPMQNPPGMNERRRYEIDVECTGAELGSSSKGQRGSRKLSILRVREITGVVVPPKAKNDEGDDTPPMFDTDGDPTADAAGEASADEGDEIRAAQAEKRAAKKRGAKAAEDAAQDAAEPAADPNNPDADPWPGDAGDAGAPPADADANVTPMFKEASE